MESELALAYKNAPRKVRVGRILMLIGCVLFFGAAFMDLLSFILILCVPEQTAAIWSDPSEAIQIGALPLLSGLFVVAGIGGICFLRDKGGRMKSFATLAAVVMIVVFIIDTILALRTLIRGFVAPTEGMQNPWLTFFLDLFDIQLSGGIYILGWFLVKDFVGD